MCCLISLILKKVEKNKPFKVSFKVVNNGSSPFYYNWPVEISLLNKRTRKKVWSKTLDGVNISEWMPGDDWDKATSKYRIEPPVYQIEKEITLDTDLPEQEYVIALSVLDPAEWSLPFVLLCRIILPVAGTRWAISASTRNCKAMRSLKPISAT